MSIVWRDKVLSSYNGNLESVMIYNGNDEKVEVPNGVFVKLDGLDEMGREVKKAILAEDATEEVLLVDSPEVHYLPNKDLDDFVNEADKVARAFRLADGDVISLTEDLIDADDLAIGDELTVGENGRLTALAEDPEADAPVIRFIVREDARYELTRKQKAWRLDIVR